MNLRRRGIYLLTSLIFALMVVMFVSAGLMLGRGGTHAAVHAADLEAADLAAQSGLQYCLARLVENPAWRGNGNARVVDTPELVVEEDNGNIVGLLLDQGRVSQFRVRFNYQDDAHGDADGTPDPALTIQHPFVSVNNLVNGGSAGLPRADGPAYSVLPASPRPANIPGHSVALLVEGRTGPGLRDHTGAAPNAPPAGSVHTRVLEATYRIENLPGADAVAQGGSNIEARLQDVTGVMSVTSASGGETPRVRSKGTVSVTNPDGSALANYASDGGEVLSGPGSLNANYDAGQVTVNTEAAGSGFYNLTWSDVKKADASDPTLPAGTYVWWDNGTLHYYDMNYSDYVTFIEGSPSSEGALVDPGALPSGLSIDLAARRVTITGDLSIAPTGAGSTDFAMIPRSGAQEEPDSAAAGGPAPALPGSRPADAASATNYYNVVVNDFNVGAPFHQLLMTLGTTGSIDDGSGNTITWDIGNLNMNNDKALALQHLFSGGSFHSVDPPAALVNGASSPFTLDIANFNTWVSAAPLGGEPEGEIDLGGAVTDSLTVKDLEVHFQPPSGQSATLSAAGNVRIGAGVFGEGGSITSEREIRIVGARTDLAANPNGVEGVNLYAKGDIVLNALVPNTASPGNFLYESFNLKGVVYTWGNFVAQLGYEGPDVGAWGNLNIHGAIIAYGGDPATQQPGDGGGGAIRVTAHGANFVYDPAYLLGVHQTLPPSPLSPLYWDRLH